MRSIPKLATILVTAAIASAPFSARAQTDVQQQQPPGWVFTPSIAVGGSWDSNVLLSDASANPPGDYATPITPMGNLEFRGKRTRFSGTYAGSLNFYRTLTELNSSEQRLQAFWQHRATPRVTVFAQESFTLAPTTDTLQLAGIPFYRIGTRANAIRGGIEALLDRHTTLSTTYTLRHVTFDEDERLVTPLQGGYAHEALASIRRALSPHVAVGGQYELRRAIFTQGLDRFNMHSGSVSFEFQPARRLSLTGSVGLTHMGAGLDHPAHTGPTWAAAVTRVTNHARFSASYQRSFIPAFGFGGTMPNEEWAGHVHVPFAANRAYVTGGVSWFDNDSLVPERPSVRSLWVSSTLGYRATRWLTLEGFVSRARQTTEQVLGVRERNLVGFRLVAARQVKLH